MRLRRGRCCGVVPMRRRAPIDAHGGRATSNTDLQIACRVVDRPASCQSCRAVDAEVGRHRTIRPGLLVACQLNALARHHRAHLSRWPGSSTPSPTTSGPSWHRRTIRETYTGWTAVQPAVRVLDAAMSTACGWTPSGWPTGWRASVPGVPTRARAVDGTDVETWGALTATRSPSPGRRGGRTQLMDDGTIPKPKKPARKARSRCRSRWRTSTPSTGRPGRAPLGHQLPSGRTVRRLRAAPGRAGPGCEVDERDRQDQPVRRGPRCGHLLLPGPGRHPPGQGHRRRPDRRQGGGGADRRRGVGSRATACASRAPSITSWPRPASTRPSSPSPTSAASARSPATPCSSTGSCSRASCPTSCAICRPRREGRARRRRRRTRPSSTCGPAGA